MIGNEKIRPEHRERRAFVYARQSSPTQLLHNRTSTERQFDLQGRAVELGWPSERVELIADDLGRSGKFSENRNGFQRLAAECGLGRVGVVLSLDVSRLARSSADWHRLLEIAALTRTLIADEHTVYDPRDPNDRLVLGMKGTMAEFELEWLRHRMLDGLWHRARKGEHPMRPPVGYIQDDEDGRFQIDPNEEVRRVVALLFERYRLGSSVLDVTRYFHEHGLRFPGRYRERVTWQPLTRSRAHQVLHNPLYAGTYVFGRTRKETTLVDGQRRSRLRAVPLADWPVVIHGAHPAYITWEQFMANQKRMTAAGPRRDGTSGPGAPRDGAGLLQGLLRCGHCGHPLSTRYAGNEGRYPQYFCNHLWNDGAGRPCLASSSRFVDDPIVELVLQSLTRENLQAATRVIEIIEQQDAAVEQQWRLRIDRARYEAKRAERQYDACDPDNRVVARTLETRWNERLIELEKLEQEHEELRRRQRTELTDLDRRRIVELADDLPRLWRAKTTTDRDRKLLLRLLLREVGVRAVDVPFVLRLRVLWHTGAVTEIESERVRKLKGKRKIEWRVVATTIPEAPLRTVSKPS
jgi:DNA invertase Pin-like site-specific DNA recombinase